MNVPSMIESATLMATSRQAPVGDRYVLQTGEAGHRRLILLHNVYGPTTERLLRNVGIFPGMMCADIGCGIGTVSCWLAREVGPDGLVTSVDVSPEQLALVSELAEGLGSCNVQTHEASAYETRLPNESFDLVYCRFLLCHLQRPMDALQEFTRILKPGGALICEDIDVLDVFAEPDLEAGYERFRDTVRKTQERKGVDYELGRKLHRYFRQVGISNVQVTIDQPVYLDGEEKRLWEYTFAEAMPGMIECGAVNEESGQEILAGMRASSLDKTVLVGVASKWQVWGRKGEVSNEPS